MAQLKKDEQSVGRSAEEFTQAGRETANVAERGAKKAAALGRQESEQIGRAFEASASALGGLADSSCSDLARVANTQARLAQAMQEMGWEFMRFAQDSLRTSLQTANDLAHCRSIEDVASRQRDYLRETMEQWMEGSARLLRISSDAASEAIEELESADESQVGKHRGGEPRAST